MISKETYCELPFNGLFLNTNGDIKFCCALNSPLGNISDSSVNEIMSGDKANAIRQSILENKWHKECSMCNRAEKQSGSSQRTFSIRDENFNRGLEIESYSHYNLESIDIRWSNTCNLSCVYCFAGASSKWASILGEHIARPTTEEHQKFLKYVVENSSTLKSINFLGGEPLLEKMNIELLDSIPDSNNIGYYVLTNLSVNLNDNKVFEKLLERKNVTWAVSFETIGLRYDYVRHGSSWNLFEENLKTLYQKIDRKIQVHFTYCLYSSTRLVEFFDYAHSSPWIGNVFIQQLVTPDYLNVSFQSPEIIKRSIDEIDKCVEKYQNIFVDQMQHLQEVKKSLLSTLENAISKNYENNILKLENRLSKNNTIYDLWPELK